MARYRGRKINRHQRRDFPTATALDGERLASMMWDMTALESVKTELRDDLVAQVEAVFTHNGAVKVEAETKLMLTALLGSTTDLANISAGRLALDHEYPIGMPETTRHVMVMLANAMHVGIALREFSENNPEMAARLKACVMFLASPETYKVPPVADGVPDLDSSLH